MSQQKRLDLKAKLYQKSIWNQVKSVGNGHTIQAPIVIDFDPTTFCNLACPECISNSVLNTNRFTEKRLSELATEFVEIGVKAVVLIGGGEPLLHPGTKKIIEILAQNDVKIGLVTNGVILDRYKDVIKDSVSWIRVSVDAGSAETYGIFRPSRGKQNSFNKVISNIKLIAEVKSGAIGYSFLIMNRVDKKKRTVASNVEEIFQAAQLARNIGCDYFELKSMLNMDHFISSYENETISSIRDQISRLAKLESENFGVVHSSTLTSIINGNPSIEEKDYHTCPTAKLRTVVTPLGVYTCAYHRGKPEAYLGDVVNESFATIWRRNLQSRIDPALQCKFHCARHLMNLELFQLRNSNLDNQVVDDYDLFI